MAQSQLSREIRGRDPDGNVLLRFETAGETCPRPCNCRKASNARQKTTATSRTRRTCYTFTKCDACFRTSIVRQTAGRFFSHAGECKSRCYSPQKFCTGSLHKHTTYTGTLPRWPFTRRRSPADSRYARFSAPAATKEKCPVSKCSSRTFAIVYVSGQSRAPSSLTFCARCSCRLRTTRRLL